MSLFFLYLCSFSLEKSKERALRDRYLLGGDAHWIVTLNQQRISFDLLHRLLWNLKGTLFKHFWLSPWKNFYNAIYTFPIVKTFISLSVKKKKIGKNTVTCQCRYDNDFSIVNINGLSWNFLYICPKCHWWENIKKRECLKKFWPWLWLVSTVGHKWDTQKHSKWARF